MTGNTRTDEEIQADVLEELKWDMRVRPNEIGVAVKDGIVTLTGWVDSYVKKMAAEEAAHRVRGVKAVANDIEVRLPSSAERTDADLAEAALNALKWEAAIPAGKLDVTVSHGWMTLKGEVEYGFQKRFAEQAVERLRGVKGISNLIVIKPHLSPSNLKQNIEKALVRNAETDAQHITVEVQDSKVILHGTVRSYAEKKAAEEVAWSAQGVSEVENRIVVSLPRSGTVLQLDCEPIMQTIQSLAQQIEEIDYRIGALEAEAMQLNPLQYFVSQRNIDRLVRVEHALQDEWNNAMSELAICRSAHPAHHHFDRDLVLPGR